MNDDQYTGQDHEMNYDQYNGQDFNGDRYNQQRKILLEELDRGKEVSNLALGMYDLTPYFKDDKFDVSLSEAIMLNKNYERKIEYIGDNLYFSPPQSRALKMLIEKDRVILSAPTSFGKTMIIKEYIYRYKPTKIVYIVPTNALAYELEKSFKKNQNFSDYIIFDKYLVDEEKQIYEKKEDNSSEKFLFIGTQEKYLEIDKKLLTSIDLFVIDEAYKLQESIVEQRAYKLSETFLDSIAKNSKKIFLLTPRAKFHGFEKYKFNLFETTFNAVDKRYILLKEKDFYNKLLEKGQDEKTILFCSKPKLINSTYERLKNSLKNIDNDDFVKILESDIHPDWSVIKLLKGGILTHHGQMPKYVQNRMINLFNNSSQYNILFGTNSISEGINTVTKNLFIHPECHNLDDKLLIKNTVGRAGRLGKYPIGYIYSVAEIESKLETEIEISLAISNKEELSEIEDSKDANKILQFSVKHQLEFNICQFLLEKYKLSLVKLGKILNALSKDRKFASLTNLPFIASEAYGKSYRTRDNDKVLIQGYLNYYFYNKDKEKVSLNNFDGRILYFKKNKESSCEIDNTEIINLYMQFIYSTLEYYIMPLVNIGIDINKVNKSWRFGEYVLDSLEHCKEKYYKQTYGNLNVDSLSETHLRIIGTMKDYGMMSSIKNINTEILNEIQECLKNRYSTIDVLNVIEELSRNSKKNKNFFAEIKKKYIF